MPVTSTDTLRTHLFNKIKSYVNEDCTKALQKFYPSVEGYLPYTLIQNRLINKLIEATTVDNPRTYQQMPRSIMASKMLEFGVPIYYINSDLFHAINNTNLPDDFSLEQIKIPMPNMTVMIPLNRLFYPAPQDYRSVGAISISNLSPNTKIKGLLKSDEVLFWPHEEGALCIGTIGSDPKPTLEMREGTEIIYTRGLKEKFKDTYDLGKVFYAVEEPTPSTTEFNLVIDLFVCKFLLYLNAYPEKIQKGHQLSSLRKTSRRSMAQSNIWTPNWINKDYRLTRINNGTHASPRMHWRRGHYRNQRIGEGRNLSKITWIEPTLVNAE